MREKRKPNGKANKIVAISKQSDYDAIEDNVSPKALEWFRKPNQSKKSTRLTR